MRRQGGRKARAEARAHGDVSENAESDAEKRQEGVNESRKAGIEEKISSADVIDGTKLSGDTVKFGATVDLVDEDTEEEVSYKIVGEIEADVKKGRVSITSPIARALIGKSVGDSVEVGTPGGGTSYEILKLRFT